jgi:hypothetical protein
MKKIISILIVCTLLALSTSMYAAAYETCRVEKTALGNDFTLSKSFHYYGGSYAGVMSYSYSTFGFDEAAVRVKHTFLTYRGMVFVGDDEAGTDTRNNGTWTSIAECRAPYGEDIVWYAQAWSV